MVAPNTLRNKNLKLSRGEVVSLGKLDALLDVKVEEFEPASDRLVRRLARAGATIDVGPLPRPEAPVNLSVPLRGMRQYQRELHRLQPMDRAEEFRMARRYEFLQRRTAAALRGAGYPRDRLDEFVRQPRSRVLEVMPARARERARQHAEQCLAELEVLRNRYVEGALYLVLSTVHRYSGLGVDTADLIQEGNASLFQAIEGFDWRRDVRFKTYAQYWVHQAVLKLLYNSSRTVRIPVWVQKTLRKMQRLQEAEGRPLTVEELGERLSMPAEKVDELQRVRRRAVSLDAAFRDDQDTNLGQMLPDESQVPVPEQIREGDLKSAMTELLEVLPPRERMILERRYGLTGKEPETLSDIAGDLGITAERVRQLQNAAIGRLQKPNAVERLKLFA